MQGCRIGQRKTKKTERKCFLSMRNSKSLIKTKIPCEDLRTILLNEIVKHWKTHAVLLQRCIALAVNDKGIHVVGGEGKKTCVLLASVLTCCAEPGWRLSRDSLGQEAPVECSCCSLLLSYHQCLTVSDCRIQLQGKTALCG